MNKKKHPVLFEISECEDSYKEASKLESPIHMRLSHLPEDVAARQYEQRKQDLIDHLMGSTCISIKTKKKLIDQIKKQQIFDRKLKQKVQTPQKQEMLANKMNDYSSMKGSYQYMMNLRHSDDLGSKSDRYQQDQQTLNKHVDKDKLHEEIKGLQVQIECIKRDLLQPGLKKLYPFRPSSCPKTSPNNPKITPQPQKQQQQQQQRIEQKKISAPGLITSIPQNQFTTETFRNVRNIPSKIQKDIKKKLNESESYQSQATDIESDKGQNKKTNLKQALQIYDTLKHLLSSKHLKRTQTKSDILCPFSWGNK